MVLIGFKNLQDKNAHVGYIINNVVFSSKSEYGTKENPAGFPTGFKLVFWQNRFTEDVIYFNTKSRTMSKITLKLHLKKSSVIL